MLGFRTRLRRTRDEKILINFVKTGHEGQTIEFRAKCEPQKTDAVAHARKGDGDGF